MDALGLEEKTRGPGPQVQPPGGSVPIAVVADAVHTPPQRTTPTSARRPAVRWLPLAGACLPSASQMREKGPCCWEPVVHLTDTS